MGMILLSASDWFAGLLSVMIIITALFAVILYIAMRPATKGDIGIKELLSRREAEITAEILSNKDDKAKTDELMAKLREVESAENLIKELVGEDEEPAPQEPAKKKVNVVELLKSTKNRAAKEAAAADAESGATTSDKTKN